MEEVRKIRPQEGYQMKALSSSADILISGASAGVGKTFALLLEPVRNITIKRFGGVIFRRTSNQIRNEGGLWDTSMKLYPHLNAKPKETVLEWHFPNKNKLKFSHLEHEKNILDWQGSEIPFIGFDELPHFTKKQFFYLISRNRSTCGVNPYVRATCNPDPESWVFELIKWWIDDETGFPIPERDGAVRFMLRDGDNYIWGDTKAEVISKADHILGEILKKGLVDPNSLIKSVSFISGSIYDNKELLSVNPGYLGNLLSQDKATVNALFHGNWKEVISDKEIYDYNAFRSMFGAAYEKRTGEMFITSDIAMKGSNKFVVMVWDGRHLEDLLIMDKSKGNQVIDGIKKMQKSYQVPNHRTSFDNDGVGQFVDGFIDGAIEFNNGASPMVDPESKTTDSKGVANKPNYANLKTQCFYKSGDKVAAGEITISEKVANMMYDDKMTVRQRLMYERKAIKKAKADHDGKLKIIGKEEMKTMLNGDSPDLMDAFMQRELFGFSPKPAKLKFF